MTNPNEKPEKELTPEEIKKNRLWNGMIFLVLCFAFILVYFMWPKSSELELYKNQDFGFQIKHPSDWTINHDIEGVVVAFISKKKNTLDIFQENVNIVVHQEFDLPSNLKLYAQESVKQLDFLFGDDIQMLDQSPQPFAGGNGYQLLYLGKANELNFKVWQVFGMEPGGAVYQFTYTAVESQYDDFLPQVKSMLESFRLM